MAQIETAFKETILRLPKKELEKLVLKVARKDKDFRDYLLIHYVDPENGAQRLYEQAKEDLDHLMRKNYKGFSEQLQLAHMLAACHKRINAFGKVCGKKELEMELVMYVLNIPFSLPEDNMGTCFTQYDYRIALLIKKAISLLQKKMHEDFHIEYAPTLNTYLDIIHRKANHLDSVYDLPGSV